MRAARKQSMNLLILNGCNKKESRFTSWFVEWSGRNRNSYESVVGMSKAGEGDEGGQELESLTNSRTRN